MAQEGGVFSAGSICQTARLYAQGAGKERIQKRFEEQIAIFLKNDMDLLIAEVSLRLFRQLAFMLILDSGFLESATGSSFTVWH